VAHPDGGWYFPIIGFVKLYRNKGGIVMEQTFPAVVSRRAMKHLLGGMIVSASVLLVSPLVGVAHASPDTTTSTFTTITSSANPVVTGIQFTVMGTECDRVANVHPTGKLIFKDVTSKKALGKAALTPDPTYENCSDASVTDTEALAAGNYTIKAHYKPGGAVRVHKSPAATYVQTVTAPS